MERFGATTRGWFQAAFAEPTPVQERGWEAIASGEHALLIAPTGSGKTLAAFLWCIDQLVNAGPGTGTRVLYVSPLKALVYDVERNLRAPLTGIGRRAELEGARVELPRVDVRTGDTTPQQRRQQAKDPAQILVTTPESLYLLLGSQARENLRSVGTVIVDEVHALAGTKRGAHLALSLERLSAITGRDPQRIGLSATAQPLSLVARFLGGDRIVSIVDTSQPPKIDLEIHVPVGDMTLPQESSVDRSTDASTEPARVSGTSPNAAAPPTWGRMDTDGSLEEDGREATQGHVAPNSPDATEEERSDGDPAGRGDPDGFAGRGEGSRDPSPGPTQSDENEKGMWPVIVPRLLTLIREHTSTILFVNSRGLCERLAHRLNDMAGEPLVRAHHGSLAHHERTEVEEALKRGSIACIVATSSLELGIDMGAVDLVLLVESPGSVARGLQRIGRAGHGVGEVSKGRLFPKHRGDLLEAAVVARRMAEGAIEALAVPENPLDVLAQQIVAMVATEDWSVAELEATLRRAANYRELPKDALLGVLDMLAGRYPSNSFADLRPRIVWDRERDLLQTRRGARLVAMVNGGTIPDRGHYGVHVGEDGPRVGELDEEMVYESTAGEVFTLGASTWRVERITRDRVIVSPAPGEMGKLPFWRGDGPGRPIELGRALGAFVRELCDRPEAEAMTWLADHHHLDPLAARNLLDYVGDQREATGTLPTDRAITIERFHDELGDYRVCILSPFGQRVHAPWALALEARLSAHNGYEVQAVWSDDGIVLRFADADELPSLEMLLPAPEELEDLLVEQLAASPLFAGLFRENAARALLLPRRRPGSRTPLWMQRRRSSELLAIARRYPAFPIIMETYRSCMRDVFDLDALRELLGQIRARQLRVDFVETSSASPFAQNLVFEYVAAYLYDGDAPLAERRAHALSLDRALLRQLLGEAALRELLDPKVIARVEAELQCLIEERHARHADGMHDLLRRLGDLRRDELHARSTDGEAQLAELERARRAVTMRIGGEERIVAVEDVALYRDALGCAPPSGLATVFLEPSDAPLAGLVQRYARTHGPFTCDELAARYGVTAAQVESWVAPLIGAGELTRGELRPGGEELELCDPDVLRRIKRRTLAELRGELAPVEVPAVARFLPAWHGLDRPEEGLARLQETLVQLEGIPLPFGELERVILPARVRDYRPAMLDELGAMGWLVWVGVGALGPTDGRVALYRRERVASLLDALAPPEELGELERTLLEHLQQRGACFFAELANACAPARHDEVLDALQTLIWSGQCTNDTFAPLRALGSPRSRSRRVQSRALARAAAGRWSLCTELLHGAPSTTERAHARAVKLLERHGLVTREVSQLEALPGGFSGVYPVLRAMEEAGKVRRGYFVQDLGGAQFAYPGAVDRLRAAQHEPPTGALVLSAVDPANAYGWLLPWPEHEGSTTRQKPRRVAGAYLVMVAGEPVLYLGAGARHLLTFPAAREPGMLEQAARALEDIARTRRGKSLRVEQIDGTAARQSDWASQLLAINFTGGYRGLTLEV
ncbi:MAG: DEAD/DEAH box helicase [Myxococcales bacterium]|nr:DEAD/DEAH box helicase [Myxococcales bacterium]